jgi:ectoine hydroxylase-related dioxygenase (phytanoyl-CoA dioxygenase family)
MTHAQHIANFSGQYTQHGHTTIPNIYTNAEIENLTTIINNAHTENPNFRGSNNLFAIRQFLKEIPEIIPHIFTDTLKDIIVSTFGPGYFITKSIYFDKPPASNWFVAWHQDITISVKDKIPTDGYGPWTTKEGQFAVQPPLPILQNNFTIRIHLDDTDEHNGALKVIDGSHLHGIRRTDAINTANPTICRVNAGGIMLMHPLLFHSSSRTTNQQRRRVIHIECSNQPLPAALQWSEYMPIS